jgi:hypothetical protein
MNWLIITYIAISLGWASWLTIGINTAARQENKRFDNIKSYLFVLAVGAIWPLSMPFLIHKWINK